jgi:ribosomal protein S10
MPRMSKSEKMLKQQEELEKRQAQEWEEFKVDYHKRLMFLVYEFSSRSVFNVNRSSGVSFSFSARQAEKMYGYPFSKL